MSQESRVTMHEAHHVADVEGPSNMYRIFFIGVVMALAAASRAAAQEKKEGASSGKIHGGQVEVISAPDGTQGQAVVVINPPPWSAAEKVYGS
jgi:hypothetical protein